MQYEEQTFVLRNQDACIIKHLAIKDADATLALIKETSEETTFLLQLPEEIQMQKEEEQAWLQAMQDSEHNIILGAFWNKELVGCASIVAKHTCAKMKHRADLSIVVKKKAWGLKVGSILMHEIINIARSAGYEQIELSVNAHNHTALALYKKLGFVTYGILNQAFYQKDGTYDRAYEMVLYLQNEEAGKHVEQIMYEKAIRLIQQRFPQGWGGAAVVHTENDQYYTSVALETYNSSASLCIETGAILEAYKYNENITHCLCVVREDEHAPFSVLTPCGICQERLRYWGTSLKVGVTTAKQELQFISLDSLQPFHWSHAYPQEELEHYEKKNSLKKDEN